MCCLMHLGKPYEIKKVHKICHKIKEIFNILISMFLKMFSPYQYKYALYIYIYIFLLYIYSFYIYIPYIYCLNSRTCFCCHYENLQTNHLLKNRQSVFWSPGKLLDMAFICIHVKKRYKYDFVLCNQKPLHGTINSQLCNLRMTFEKCFLFH